MSTIEISKEEKQILTRKIQGYFERELNQEIGQFDAEFLLDFFTREIGPYFFNRGVMDARAIVERQLETIGDDLYAIEQPTEFAK